MTEAALRALTPTAMATLRWGLYAKALASSATADLDHALEALADEDKPPTSTMLKVRRAQRREELTQAQAAKAQIRALLFLDDDSDDAEGVA